jgi:hypothetical protein
MSPFHKLYNHLCSHMRVQFSPNGRTAVFTDGAHEYQVEYVNNQPITIRHMSQEAVMRPGDPVAPWAQGNNHKARSGILQAYW